MVVTRKNCNWMFRPSLVHPLDVSPQRNGRFATPEWQSQKKKLKIVILSDLAAGEPATVCSCSHNSHCSLLQRCL